ncbi:MAG: hypothetical protein RLY93_16130 [Sumerlaeia bacterium]
MEPNKVTTHDASGRPGEARQDAEARARTAESKAKSHAEDVRVQARAEGQSAEARAQEKRENLSRQAKDAYSDAKDTARQQATETKHQAAEFAQRTADEQKARAAAEVRTFGEALHRAGNRLEEGDDPNIADYAHGAAERLEGVANYLETTSPGHLLDDASDFTRRNPEYVLGGMFLAGLALSRFLKASSPTRRRRDSSEYDEVFATSGYPYGDYEPYSNPPAGYGQGRIPEDRWRGIEPPYPPGEPRSAGRTPDPAATSVTGQKEGRDG